MHISDDVQLIPSSRWTIRMFSLAKDWNWSINICIRSPPDVRCINGASQLIGTVINVYLLIMCTNHCQLIISGLNELNYLCTVSDLIQNIHHSVVAGCGYIPCCALWLSKYPLLATSTLVDICWLHPWIGKFESD